MTEQEKFVKAVGKNIDKKRKEKELSFQELALLCDIEKSSLVTITSQGGNITLTSLYKIAKGLEVAVWELLKV
ncbi:helix-turn-helix domain-containing protein [Ferruginibacter profundus]